MKNIKAFLLGGGLVFLFLMEITFNIFAFKNIKNWWSGTNYTVSVNPVLSPTTSYSDLDENAPAIIQIALLLDVSGSMSGLIEQAKSQLWNIVSDLSQSSLEGQDAPRIAIALYEYGNNNAIMDQHYMRQILPFTEDMDALSEQLFQLSTGGSQEYCGLVIHKALNELDWSTRTKDLGLIYIAGNESFHQGRFKYKNIFEHANQLDISVNTIFCGPREQGIILGWEESATLAKGEYSYIDHNLGTVYYNSPYDDQINQLNSQLNNTYIPYGQDGEKYKANAMAQDVNASSYSKENAASRAIFKSSKNYKNEKWDLLDAYDKDKSILKKKQQLPKDLAAMEDTDLEQTIQQTKAERQKIKEEIADLSKKRKVYIEEQKKKNKDTASSNLENSMLNSIKEKGKKKGMPFKE